MLDRYFRTRSWEQPVYIRLGVRRFRRWMLRLVGRSTARRLGWLPLLDREDSAPVPSALEAFERQTRKNELAHLAALLVLGVFGLKLLIEDRAANALVLFLINVPVNIYPILLQRDHRARIERIVRHVGAGSR